MLALGCVSRIILHKTITDFCLIKLTVTLGSLYLLPNLITADICGVTQPVRMITQTIWLQAMLNCCAVLLRTFRATYASVCISCHQFLYGNQKMSLYWNKNGLCLLCYPRVLSRKHPEVCLSLDIFIRLKTYLMPCDGNFLGTEVSIPSCQQFQVIVQ